MIPVCLMKNRIVPFAATTAKPSKIERHAQNLREQSDLQTRGFLSRLEQERRADDALFQELMDGAIRAADLAQFGFYRP